MLHRWVRVRAAVCGLLGTNVAVGGEISRRLLLRVVYGVGLPTALIVWILLVTGRAKTGKSLRLGGDMGWRTSLVGCILVVAANVLWIHIRRLRLVDLLRVWRREVSQRNTMGTKSVKRERAHRIHRMSMRQEYHARKIPERYAAAAAVAVEGIVGSVRSHTRALR